MYLFCIYIVGYHHNWFLQGCFVCRLDIYAPQQLFSLFVNQLTARSVCAFHKHLISLFAVVCLSRYFTFPFSHAHPSTHTPVHLRPQICATLTGLYAQWMQTIPHWFAAQPTHLRSHIHVFIPYVFANIICWSNYNFNARLNINIA